MKKLALLFLSAVAVLSSAWAQNSVTVTGTVVYQSDKEPLIGATIMPSNGSKGTSTDIDGKFILKVEPDVKYLTVTYIGMEPMQVKIPTGGGIYSLKCEAQTPRSVRWWLPHSESRKIARVLDMQLTT